VAGPFLGGLFFFMFLFLMSQVLRLAEMFIVHGVPFWTLLKMVSLLSISFLPTALPIAFLIAFVTAIAYWVIQTAAMIGIKDGWMPPVFAMQLPNLVVLIAAVFAFRRAMW
jgi:lipopolysaccharide export LptBFGC system permease protein LptF